MKPIFEGAFLVMAALLVVVPVLRPAQESEPSSTNGAVVARQALQSYGRLLARVARDAADALEKGEVASDGELLKFLATRRAAAADAAFQPLHEHQQQRIGVQRGEEFNRRKAAQLMREYAQGWKL